MFFLIWFSISQLFSMLMHYTLIANCIFIPSCIFLLLLNIIFIVWLLRHEEGLSCTDLVHALSTGTQCLEQRQLLYCHLVKKYSYVYLPEGKAGRLLQIQPPNRWVGIGQYTMYHIFGELMLSFPITPLISDKGSDKTSTSYGYIIF